MKLKFYLRGLGVGILVTTLILVVNNNFQAIETTENPNTVDSVLNSTRASMEKTEKSTEQQIETIAVASSVTNIDLTKQNTTEKTTEAKVGEITQDSTKSTIGEPIVVVLSDILYAEKAAQIIAKAGIIEDWEAFNNYLKSTDYAVKIQNGTYTLFKGQDYEGIAKTITEIR